MRAWLVRLVGILLLLIAIGLALSRAPERSVQSLVPQEEDPAGTVAVVKEFLARL